VSDTQADHSRLAELAAKLSLHEHLCVIYETREEQSAVASPFLATGLERREKCLLLADENTAAAVLDALRKRGTDVDRYLRGGALTITHKRDTDLQQGRFDPDWWIGFLNQASAEAAASGFSAFRILGDLSGAPGEDTRADNFLAYESRLNRFLRNHNARMICQYSRNLDSPEFMLGIIRTHPVVVYGGLVCKNPYYVPPEEFLKPNQAALEVERLLHNILTYEEAQEALQHSEERWRAVFENSAVGIALTDPQGVFTVTNRAYQEMVGYSDEELRALCYLDITYEEDRQANRVLAAELWEGKGQQFRHEKRYRRKDGKLIWVRNTVSLAPGTETAPQFGMAIVEDITERKQAEEALRRSEAYLAEGQKLSHTGSWAWNLSSGEVFWSQETYRIFGIDPVKPASALLEAFLERIHPEDRPRIAQGLKTAATQKRRHETDYRIVLAGGLIRYIHEVVYPVTNEAGEVIERYGLAMDVTEHKRTADELQGSRDQLRALAARLQKVREEERTRVAREIHDELGQALTAIKIDLSALCRELPADRKQRSQSVLQQVDETIQSVRRISTELRPAILDAAGLVAAVEWAAEEFAARTGTKCQLDLPQEDIVIDPEHATALFRIFQETLTNVARHAGATAVDVRLVRENGILILEVRDNGKGIREEQLSASSSLGILGMRERALLLGGELTIVSALGQGTIVRVRIPATHPIPPKDG
jgi:PAS domain S-box-containing protein